MTGALITTSLSLAGQPNILLIIADDCTYLDLEVYGGQAETPRLNQLASEGMKFTRCFQTAPMCSPTRHNLYTGLYPVRSGAWPNHTRVYDGTKSIAHYLKEVGYNVALSGKSHIGPKESFPFEFSDEFRTADPADVANYPKMRDFIETSKAEDRPFCLIACSNEPHTPYNKGDLSKYDPASLNLPPSFVDTPETRMQYSKYLAEISYFDRQCGAALDLLKETRVDDNTLVMVLSEQGSGFPFAKWTCFELGLTSAMIVRWPGKVATGAVTDALVEYVDVTPTLMDVAGISNIPEYDLDGQSFLPVLKGEVKQHKKFTFGLHTTRGIHNGSEHFAIRSCGTKNFRYIRNLHSDQVFKNVVTRPGGDRANFWTSWKAQAAVGNKHADAMTDKYQNRPAEELYDVVKDPHCLNNLAGDPYFKVVKTELSKQLDQWMKSQGDTGHGIEDLALTRQAGFKGPNVPQ